MFIYGSFFYFILLFGKFCDFKIKRRLSIFVQFKVMFNTGVIRSVNIH